VDSDPAIQGAAVAHQWVDDDTGAGPAGSWLARVPVRLIGVPAEAQTVGDATTGSSPAPVTAPPLRRPSFPSYPAPGSTAALGQAPVTASRTPTQCLSCSRMCKRSWKRFATN